MGLTNIFGLSVFIKSVSCRDLVIFKILKKFVYIHYITGLFCQSWFHVLKLTLLWSVQYTI